MKFRCEHCGNEAEQSTSAVNRARRSGMRLYCDRKCAGAAKSAARFLPVRGTEEWLAHKEAYDRARRQALGEALKEKKRKAYADLVASNPDLVRERQRILRAKRVDAHNEYCRQPAYVEKKAEYDRALRSAKYQDFSDAHRLLLDLEREVRGRMDFVDRQVAKGTLNKSQQRRRDLEEAQRLSTQKRIVGHAQRHQERQDSTGRG